MSNYFPFGRRTGLHLTFNVGLLVLTVFALVPAVGVLLLSFTDIRALPYLPVNWVGLQNYFSFFSQAHLAYNINALGTTVVFAVSATILQNVFALLIAVLLNQRMRGTNFYRSVVFLPTVLGVTVIGLIWSLIFNPSGGPAATVWSWFGAKSAFLGDQHLALGLLVLVQVWMSMGVAVVIYLAGLQAIPAEMYETASIDGATGWQKLRLVTIPLLAPSITANVLLCIVSSLQSYQLAYVLTGPNNPATQLLSLVIFTQGFGGSLTAGASAQTQGYASAISVVQFILVGVVSIVVLAFLRKREQKL
jgi:raffinose/stachyose/melibiose transport system permease protein